MLRKIALRLDSLNIRTRQGFRWYAASVRATLIRAGYTQDLNIPEIDATSFVTASKAGREAITKGGAIMPSDIREAERMLDLFISVGARSFVVTKLDVEQRHLWGKPYSASELRDKLPAMVRTAATRRPHHLPSGQTVMAGENLIVRPTGGVTFVQLDDFPPEALFLVRDASFAIIETSAGNFQAWIAVSAIEK